MALEFRALSLGHVGTSCDAFREFDVVDPFPNTCSTKCAQTAGGPPRLRDQHSHIRGGRVLLSRERRRLPGKTTVRSGRRTGRYAIDPSLPMQDLQPPTRAQSLSMQILQRTIQMMSLSLLSTIRLCRKSLMFATTSHSAVLRHYPCTTLWYNNRVGPL